MNDAVKEVDVDLYADDTELHYCHFNFDQLEVILQSALTQLFIWFVANKLKLSAPKSTCMVIGSRQCTHGRVLHLFFTDIALWQVSIRLNILSTVKYLGA